MERTGLWTAVPISAVLLVSAACNNTEEPSQEQEIDMKEQYLDSLTEVEKDLGDLQSAVLLFLIDLLRMGIMSIRLSISKKNKKHLMRRCLLI
ncbi:hypothetical protein [Alkalicoccobacillus plakortidis]|uniref:Uncharacterized protein n=1 Tax=Alkalicoccobacillus plakortidis TaxID=444060 RepID=A0ABT0XKU0_9BACI|nr:hypothetical protein [Alkalicoccobacillus plakortidis]MCM2675854.1 hypothetical protein [Alkalicoccobacillus plakortidis]